ncbi:hypothetical protein Tco_0505140 [Tanacetum coccineum]
MHIRNDPSFFLTNKTEASQGEELGILKPCRKALAVDLTILSSRMGLIDKALVLQDSTSEEIDYDSPEPPKSLLIGTTICQMSPKVTMHLKHILRLRMLIKGQGPFGDDTMTLLTFAEEKIGKRKLISG